MGETRWAMGIAQPTAYRRSPTASNDLGQRRPFDELEYERDDAVGLLETVDVRDVRMIQRGEGWLRARSGRVVLDRWRPTAAGL